jgi:hypothetical protein
MNEMNAISNSFPVTFAQVIKDRHFMARAHQFFRYHAAYVSCSARYQHSHSKTLPSIFIRCAIIELQL